MYIRRILPAEHRLVLLHSKLVGIVVLATISQSLIAVLNNYDGRQSTTFVSDNTYCKNMVAKTATQAPYTRTHTGAGDVPWSVYNGIEAWKQACTINSRTSCERFGG